MTEKYTGNDRRYAGEQADILYNVKRCIHAEFCVSHLSEIFDKNKRPWINADGAPTERVVSVVEMCPSGALHYERKDGVKEAIPDKNKVTVRHNGPLEIRGNLTINGATVELAQETRVTLCRCGASNNKPFCDNTHKQIAFEAVEIDAIENAPEQATGSPLTVTVNPNGSLALDGDFELVNDAGETLFVGNKTTLCRCGGSSRKPFCDGTHLRNAFEAE